MAQAYAVAGIEPPLEELLNDPITLLVMRRDGIGVADVRRAMAAGLARFASAPHELQELRDLAPALELPHATDRQFRPRTVPAPVPFARPARMGPRIEN